MYNEYKCQIETNLILSTKFLTNNLMYTIKVQVK